MPSTAPSPAPTPPEAAQRLPHLDLDAFAADVEGLRRQLREEASPADLAHLRRILRWNRGLTAFGLATAWLPPNPVTALALALGTFSRWAIVGHHVIHKGYDRVPGAPKRLTSKGFAKGHRRILDWLDWMPPEGWHQEHDVLHHYRLGEAEDPDQAQRNAFWLRDSGLPQPLRTLVVFLGAMIWKHLYYGPLTATTWMNHLGKKSGQDPIGIYDWRLWTPWKPRFWQVMRHSWAPYSLWRFGVLPALFLVLGTGAWLNALLNLLLAELLTNLWSFWVIVPNHTGDDVHAFTRPARGKGEFYLRQVIGSTNYRTGGDLNDFLHGWLNYQIEHHAFPEASMLQLQNAQPRLKAICEKHGVPYLQESVFVRGWKTNQILTGQTSLYFGEVGAEAAAK